MESGVALDRAVAEAIGMVSTHRVLGSDIEFWVDPRAPREAPRTFNPSVDLNDAFYAGEAVGLFNEGNRVLRREPGDDTWEIADILFDGDSVMSSEDTPTLAICAAILAMAGVPQISD